jgi:NAD(P)-dependent dehydrogenase (short-subunit alcohol dehydrogenase family)
MAKALVGAGAAVSLWGRDEERNAEAVAELESLGGRAHAVRCDVADESQVVAAMEGTVASLGKVDSLVANAGIGGGGRFVDLTLDEWRRVTAVDLDGAFLCLREAARHLVGRGEGGSLVVVSSVSTIHGAPGAQPYAASKAGLLAVVRGLAVELARHQIRVNAVLPGWIETEMTEPATANERFMEATLKRTPVRRWGTPDDLGPSAVFLCDPSLTFHTGDCLVVDGGYSIF